MNLYIRISDTDLCFARYAGGRSSAFSFEPYHVRPQASLTVNLREAMSQVELLRQPFDKVVVLVNGPVTPVPLAEFQEEDAEASYQYCFTPGERRRVFYDTVPASNAVFLFALNEATCRTLEDAFGDVRYTSVLCPVVQHFAAKGLANASGRRMFVYTHDGVVDVAVMEEMRLVMLNTYSVRTLADVAYYTFNLSHHLGIDVAEAPLFVAGNPLLRDPVVDELQKYASRVYAVNPAAEFNRNVVATTENVPYDLMCALLK